MLNSRRTDSGLSILSLHPVRREFALCGEHDYMKRLKKHLEETIKA